MVVKMIKWRPWPLMVTKKYQLNLLLHSLEALGVGEDENGGLKECSKLMALIKWKGPRRKLGSRFRSIQKNCTSFHSIGDDGIVEWNESFGHVCMLTMLKDNAFHRWDVRIQIISEILEESKPRQSNVGTALLNLGDFASPLKSTKQTTKIPISCCIGGVTKEAALVVTLDFEELQITQIAFDPVQRLLIPLSCIKGPFMTETNFIEAPTKRSEKDSSDEDGSNFSKRSPLSSEECESPELYDSDSIDDCEDAAVEEGSISTFYGTFSYDTLAAVNLLAAAVCLDYKEDCLGENELVLPKLIDEASSSDSDPATPPVLKRSLLSWKAGKFGFKSPKAKGEPKPYIPAATEVSINDKRFHVFLSFRGKDVRKTLVDHLFQALSAAGLSVFLDTHKLKKGEILDLSLERAIECSAIRIPIFSEGYAGSAWCLREAALMLASAGLIIPLFYQMEPTHVRYPLGDSSPYEKSFQKHYSHPDRYSREEIDGWKHALEQICCRSGWSMDMTGGFEAQLVKKVVNDIMKTLDKVPLEVAKHPVGLETLKNALIQKLDLYSAQTVVKVGIWGIGGIGKTTVAKAVYNEVYHYFEAASFVFNVRSTSLTKLQGQILKDLVNYTEEVESVEKGKYLLRDRLRGIRAIVILDDADDRVQLDALAGDWMAPASRVIVTSRDRHILNAAHISSACIHEMSGLERSEGLRLFSWHAFLRASPIPGYEKLSRRIVEACKGHPLSLEVIGAFLYDKQNDTDIECWNETVDNIAVNRDIFKTLQISYCGLCAEEQEIFLDIACFFMGESTTNSIIFWKSMYKSVHTAITNLSLKLLIKIDKKGVFDMHDLVRDMGRIIAEERQTRQWQTAQSSSSFDYSSYINISRLRLYACDSRWHNMLCTPSLRYLHLEHVRMEDIIESLPPSLRWLRVDSCSSPIRSNLFKHLISTTKKTSTSVMGNLSQLRVMDLTNWRSLENVPDNIGNLSHLQSLKLSRFYKLKCLPKTIGNLSQLVSLNLTYCENLSHLPDSIGNLSQLEYLNLTCCRILIEIPNSIGKLSQLKHLSLSWCEKLQSFPETISNLSKLERLDMLSCYAWESIPYFIWLRPKLHFCGLPPLMDKWRRDLLSKREDQDQTEEWTIVECSEAMAEIGAISARERRELESAYQERRSWRFPIASMLERYRAITASAVSQPHGGVMSSPTHEVFQSAVSQPHVGVMSSPTHEVFQSTVSQPHVTLA